MRIRNEVVAAIHAALTNDDRVPLIEQEIANGCTLPEIQRAFAGSKWRFHLQKSGLRIAIANVDELHQSHQDALNDLNTMCSQLVVQDQKLSKPWDGIPQTRVRTETARKARQVKLVEARVNRHLRVDERIDADVAIARLLESFGFEWPGGDLVFERGSARLPYYRAPADSKEIATPSGTPGLKPSPAKLLLALASAAAAKDEPKVGIRIGRALQSGVALRDIADALIDTDFRYEIVSSGRSYFIQDFDDLNHNFTGHCEEIVKLKMMLDNDTSNAELKFRSLNIREPLGFMCKALAIEADRLNRYLLPSEQHLVASDYVDEFLSGSDFSWNGDYEVERFGGENKELLEAAFAYYSAAAVAAEPGPS